MSERDDRLALGLDLGGTKLQVGLVDASGAIIASHRSATGAQRGPAAVITDIVESVEGCLKKAGRPAAALGVGTAGQIDKKTGKVLSSPNLGWREVPLKAELEERLEMPVMVTNDVRAATYGEWKYGAGRGCDDIACVFIGTGIGGGIVSGGRLMEGFSNSAAELGHITIVADGRQCTCRNRGCFEAYVGGWAIAERAQAEARAYPRAGRTLAEAAGGIDNISAVTVTEAYRKGDELAAGIVTETAAYLAAGLVSIINAVNPRVLILGGGVIQGMPEYLSLVEPLVRLNALEAALDGFSLVTAALGETAGVIGAAALARSRIINSEGV